VDAKDAEAVAKKQRDISQAAIRHDGEIRLFEALEEQLGTKTVSAKKLGNWARGMQNIVHAGLYMERGKPNHDAVCRLRVCANLSGGGYPRGNRREKV
jgi:hypothetical protein